MTRIGITGHQSIPERAIEFIETRMLEIVRSIQDPVAISCLAAGADQLGARLVLSVGGELIVVSPCVNYKTTLVDQDLDQYEILMQESREVILLPNAEPSEEAFMEAGIVVAQMADVLIAVWDGMPAVGLGGTGDVVAHARGIGKFVYVVWPEGLVR